MDRQNSHHRPTAETNSSHANQWQVESPRADTNDINEDTMGPPRPGSPDEVAKVALNANRSNSSNGEAATHFLDSINDLNADSIARLTNSGIPIEEVIANEHIQQIVIDETSRRINSIKNREYDNDYYYDDYDDYYDDDYYDDDDYDDNNYDDNNDEHSSELFSADETGDLYRFKTLDAICATDKGR